MRIIKHSTLIEFYSQPKYARAKVALERWHTIAKQADWHSLTDMRKDFPATDYVGNSRYVFNIKGNHFRLVVVAKFVHSELLIRRVLTHEEYNKVDCSTL